MTMTNEKVFTACVQTVGKIHRAWFNRASRECARPIRSVRSPNGIDGLDVSSMEHALFMCDEIPKLMEAGKREKAMRWLGYLQGALTAIGVLTLEEAKKMNMPDAATPVAVLSVSEASKFARALRMNTQYPTGKLAPDSMPTQATRAAFLRWALLENRERTDASLVLARKLESWIGEHDVPAQPFTVATARTLAASLRETPSMRKDVAGDMPTERLRRAAVRWEDAETRDDVEHTATIFAEALDEWATRAENGEATYEAADLSRAAVSEDHMHRDAPKETPEVFTPEQARAAAVRLREHPDFNCGVYEHMLSTQKLRLAHAAWWSCEDPDAERYLGEHLADMLEEWATGQEALKQIPSALTNDVTSEYWLGQDCDAIVWSSTTPTLVTVNGTQVPITELRAALDHCEKLKSAL